MKTKKPYKSRWFYCFGPGSKMIIDNNQNKIARIYGLSQGVISACLRGERRQHNGWRFTLIENPRPFVAIEKKERSVVPETEPVLQKLTPAQKKESDARHMETATAAGIRHLMKNFYPGWVNTKDTGYIFTG